MGHDLLGVAVLQHQPEPADISAALHRIDKYANQAADKNCSILCVPEASVTGYNIDKETMQSVALSADGETTREIASLCRAHRIAVAYGFAEHDNGHYYNCVQLINRDGKVVGKYRKTHLWGDLDKRLFSAGSTLAAHPQHQVVEIDGFNIGLLICYDIEFPETVRTLALHGAELILTPTGLMQPWHEVATRVVPVRAYENQLFIAYTNYCGSEGDITYEGRSCIVGPDGNDLARAAQQTTLLTATISKAAIAAQRNALPYHRDRRPELYAANSSNQ